MFSGIGSFFSQKKSNNDFGDSIDDLAEKDSSISSPADSFDADNSFNPKASLKLVGESWGEAKEYVKEKNAKKTAKVSQSVFPNNNSSSGAGFGPGSGVFDSPVNNNNNNNNNNADGSHHESGAESSTDEVKEYDLHKPKSKDPYKGSGNIYLEADSLEELELEGKFHCDGTPNPNYGLLNHNNGINDNHYNYSNHDEDLPHVPNNSNNHNANVAQNNPNPINPQPDLPPAPIPPANVGFLQIAAGAIAVAGIALGIFGALAFYKVKPIANWSMKVTQFMSEKMRLNKIADLGVNFVPITSMIIGSVSIAALAGLIIHQTVRSRRQERHFARAGRNVQDEGLSARRIAWGVTALGALAVTAFLITSFVLGQKGKTSYGLLVQGQLTKYNWLPVPIMAVSAAALLTSIFAAYTAASSKQVV